MAESVDLTEQLIENLTKVIHGRICRIYGSSRRLHHDHCEQVQQVWVRILEAIPRYDPRRGSLATFVARVADHAVMDHLRRKLAARRNPFRVAGSLNADCDHDRQFPDQPAFWPDGTAGHRDHPDRDLTDLKIDLAEALRDLPPELRKLAEKLPHETIPDIAAAEGVHRGSIYRRMESIRHRWEDGTLRDYLDF